MIIETLRIEQKTKKKELEVSLFLAAGKDGTKLERLFVAQFNDTIMAVARIIKHAVESGEAVQVTQRIDAFMKAENQRNDG